MQEPKYPPLSPEDLKIAMEIESQQFENAYRWLEAHMPHSFLDEVDPKTRLLIARNLVSFSQQDSLMPIYFKRKIIVLCNDAPDADLKILKQYRLYGIRYYRAFVSNEPPPSSAITGNGKRKV